MASLLTMVELKDSTVFDYIRYVGSGLLLIFSLVVTTYAIVTQKTNFWDIIPGWAALLLFILDLYILGVVEGLQIALVELKRQHPECYKVSHPLAYRLGQLAVRGDNTERFLMGRQVFVVFLVFFAAKLTTIHLEDGEEFLFPAPAWFRAVFLESGNLACIVVVILAQLMPQIVAAKYPVHFMQILVMRPAYYICTAVEWTGLTHATWLLSDLMSRAFYMKDDNTTINPNDVLKDVEESLEGMQVSDSYNPINPTDEKITSAGREISNFSKLVNRLNSNVSEDALNVLRVYLDRHPEKFAQFPSVVGNQMYPSPLHLSQQLRDEGHEVPAFLTEISHANHVPPHVVACELLAQNRELKDELECLRKKMAVQIV